jgi:hypothetical protein
MAWGDMSSDDAGLTLITHGLQGLGGTDTLNLMLVLDVSEGGRPTSESVKDRAYHTLRYAYLPHTGNVAAAATWRVAYALNQPLIPVWQGTISFSSNCRSRGHRAASQWLPLPANCRPHSA